MPRVIDLDDGDPWYGDQPYTNEDLKKPGFDPFEAHLAWLERRRAVTPQQEALRRQAALSRIAEELDRFKAEQKARPKPRKKKPTDPAEASLKLWKSALADVKRKKC